MNMHATLAEKEDMLTRTEVAGLLALAARTVPRLWPLESAIAVNPLAGFEEQPFSAAVQHAALLFGAEQSLPLALWRELKEKGHIDGDVLRDAAIRYLGGTYSALVNVTPDVTSLDLLMARLEDIPSADRSLTCSDLAPDAALIAKWCGAFFDQTIAATPMPNRELGLYRAVLALLGHDPEFRALAGREGMQTLLTVPRDPYEAIAEGLAETSHGSDPLDHLSSLCARLPGWAGHIRWRTEHADRGRVAYAPAGMADLLALWLLLERIGAVHPNKAEGRQEQPGGALARHFGLNVSDLDPAQADRVSAIAEIDSATLGFLFMTAAEWTYANALVPQLEKSARAEQPQPGPAAQLMFCIDVRSEPFRREIERAGNYETFGYAGFFGVPMALHPAGCDGRKRLLPVLLAPQHDVAETPKPDRVDDAREQMQLDMRDRRAAQLFDAAKLGAGSAFATAEATGPLAGLVMLARTLAPRLADRSRSERGARRDDVFQPSLDRDPARSECEGFSLAEKVGYTSALFRLTGLKPDTARLVVLAGHGGSAVNNPYAAALDCGACGGHAGGSNARVVVAMLNDRVVRAGLAEQGLVIPETTYFLAAQHDTTTDEVTLFDRSLVPAGHHSDLAALEADLARAGSANRARRAALLGRAPSDLLVGAAHWGEIRPEWGLANNAAFLIGPRAWTREIELDGRAFLHSYDWRDDPSGEALTTILTAPMVVAQWINCQYLFSTIDNNRYGSGDKVTHNVVGGIGVVQGNGGDLKVGLPRQSLFTDGGIPYHVPQRLLTVVLGPTARVQAAVEANPILARLFGNGWVQLVVVDPEDGKARRWRADTTRPGTGANAFSISL